MKKFILAFCLLFSFYNGKAQTVVDLTNCNGNCLWTIEGTTDVRTWQLLADTFVFDGLFVNGSYNGLSVGYVPIQGDTILNTFISTDFETSYIRYWTGNDWQCFNFQLPFSPIGMGSYQNSTYIVGEKIWYFDGTNVPVLISTERALLADVAVDELGRAWLVTGEFSANDPSLLESIIVMDNQGEIIHEFPFITPFVATNAYGMAISNDTIYLGFGTLNAAYPGKILSVVIENNAAIITDKIFDFSAFNYNLFDLASNRSGDPLKEISSSDTHLENNSQLSIYPNPTQDIFTINQTASKKLDINLYSVHGVLLKQLKSSDSQINIDLSNYSSGIYFLTIYSSATLLDQRKIMKL